MKKFFIIVFILLLTIVVGGYFYLKGAEFTIYIEKEKMQTAVNLALPYEEKFASIFTLTVKDAEIHLQDNSDRIGVSTNLDLEVGAKNVSKKVGKSLDKLKGLSKIKAFRGLKKLDKLNLDASKNFDGFIHTETGLRYDKDNYTFYLLNPEIKKLDIDGVSKSHSKIVAKTTKDIIRKHLSKIPVYKISNNDIAFKLARATVKKVAVENGKLVITLGSGW